jgi:hypothetical protein
MRILWFLPAKGPIISIFYPSLSTIDYISCMKYLIPLLFTFMLSSGCKKDSCVQCARQVAAAQQSSSVNIDYNIVYIEFCGRQADTAMTSNPNLSSAFVATYRLVPFSCFYNQ